MYFNDGTWSNGLVSAAKSVAAATRDLCESASDVMKGDVHRDRLVVAARNVSSSTTQLLSAAVVRADRLSQNQVRLKAAGKAVTNATQLLVKACDESIAFNDTEAISDVLDGKTATAAKVLEMEAQMSILKMEKELERARNKLATVRKNKYDKSGDRHSTGSDLNLDQDSGSQEIFKAKTASSDRNSAPPLKPTSAGGFFRKSKN